MKISVIVPTYKPGEYIFECMDSLLHQTLDKSLFEVIVVLNGCDEPWHSRLQEYIEQNLYSLHIRFFQTNQPGVSNARNLALDCANGEYIAFIDDDDYVSELYLEELLNNSSSDCVALSDSLYVNDITGEIMSENAHHQRFLVNQKLTNPTLFQSRTFFNGPCMKLLHRDIIGKRRFDIRFANGEDSLMMFQISDRIKRLAYTSHSAVYYRRVRANSATTKRRSRIKLFSNTLCLMVEYSKSIMLNPLKYDYLYALSRYAAGIKNVLVG